MDFGDSGRKYSCFVCGQVYQTYPEMRDHVMTQHEEGREWVRCPLAHCDCPVRDLRVHYDAKHRGLPLPKNCQLRATVWYDQRGGKRKKKVAFAEGHFVSAKNGGKAMHYRSGWELKVYQLLEQLGEVHSYQVEPLSITYYFNGKQKTYIPDLLVRFTDGRCELWEIKPANQTGVPQIKAKKAAAEDFCQTRGIVYKMITEGVIDRLAQNVKDQLD